jgi:uncharacterized protein YndB with AHSA1/START domain
MSPFPEQSRATVEINAPVDVVYSLVANLTRMGEWSPECYLVEWEDGSSAPVVGAHFRGFNRVGSYEWDVPGEITNVRENELFEFKTPRGSTHATTWRFEFSGDSKLTRVTESFDAPMLNLEGSASNFDGRFEMLHTGIQTTLDQIKMAAEA